MQNDDYANAVGALSLYLVRASFSKALGLLAAGAALLLVGDHSIAVVATLTTGATSLGAMVGRLLDNCVKRLGLDEHRVKRPPRTPSDRI